MDDTVLAIREVLHAGLKERYGHLMTDHFWNGLGIQIVDGYCIAHMEDAPIRLDPHTHTFAAVRPTWTAELCDPEFCEKFWEAAGDSHAKTILEEIGKTLHDNYAVSWPLFLKVQIDGDPPSLQIIVEDEVVWTSLLRDSSVFPRFWSQVRRIIPIPPMGALAAVPPASEPS
jgi:hypothetical protein